MAKITEAQATTLWTSRSVSIRDIDNVTDLMISYRFYSALDGMNYALAYDVTGVIDKDSTLLEIKSQVIADLQDKDYEDLTVNETEETI
jgi:hypothetical protein